MRLSLTGGQVDCTMKTSRPRMLSSTSTLISPSLKRSTWALPGRTPSALAIAAANAGVALPDNISIFGSSKLRGSAMGDSALAASGLAGAAGFEPAIHGIKTRCLTTWLRPNGPRRLLSCRPTAPVNARAGSLHTKKRFRPAIRTPVPPPFSLDREGSPLSGTGQSADACRSGQLCAYATAPPSPSKRGRIPWLLFARRDA